MHHAEGLRAVDNGDRAVGTGHRRNLFDREGEAVGGGDVRQRNDLAGEWW